MANESKLESLTFSTQGTPPGDRVRLWESHNALALIPLDIRTLDSKPLKAREENINLPSIRLADVFGSAQIVERSESFINDNPTDVIAIFFALEGDTFFFHTDGHLTLQPGQAVVYDADRPFTRGFSLGLREMVLTVPRHLYTELVPAPRPKLPYVFDFSRSSQSLQHNALANFVRRSLSERSADDISKTERNTLSLVSSIFEPASSSDSILLAAQHFISLNLGNSDLSVAEIAAAAGISQRQLARVFAAENTTVSNYLLQQRLKIARTALASPTHDRYSVATIAALFGFSSSSHFGKAFKRAYGTTPLQWRKESRAEM
ncbi:helix-turn-helix domain-containing protein [Corynebacterium breve]|uniref:Helix-turn-helix domain-containing protein n=1 Tax=Corynebacterium breve TaxID=3049799 RepID=A0ABY8VIX0_9CORY|nr:helix-turn-helix domain-containing protein [Corynebacterium breve]WIM68149.1 helix-turn-helix domain-containing protein [Corynebacterium breve]